MRPNSVAHLPGQVQILERLVDADALGGVVPAVGREVRREGLLAGVPEWRVADVVAEGDRLGQRLVEGEPGSQRAGDLCDLQGVRQSGDEVIPLRVEVDLRLVLQAPKCLRVDDPIPIPLEGGPVAIRLLGPNTPAAGAQSARCAGLLLIGGPQSIRRISLIPRA